MEKKKNDNKKYVKLIIVGALCFVIGVGLFLYFMLRSQGQSSGGGGDDNKSSFVTMVPIFTAVWIPFIVTKSKEKNLKKKEWKLVLVVIGVVLALLSAGILAFLLLK